MRRVATCLMLIAIAVFGGAGCGADDDNSDSDSDAAEQSATSSTTSEAGPLEGTWRTEPITVGDMTEIVREAGLGNFADDFEKHAPISEVPTELILEIDEATWNLSAQPEGGQPIEIDYDAEYEVSGDHVAVSHEGDANTYRWSMSGDALELTWLETTYGDFKGTPEEVFQRALYETAEFGRTS